jgi:hypothetical protein
MPMNYRLQKPFLNRRRMAAALITAMAADGLQLVTGPLKFALADQVIDVAAMALVSLSVGFHPFFLPTFIAEFIPVFGMLPTWTGCVALVLIRRWKAQQYTQPPVSSPPPMPPRSGVIDV